jgi:predicted helicase
MERYAITTNKDSGIVNDPNLWCEEHNNPKYILNLLLSIITLSIKTNELVKQLPKIEF